MSKLSELEEWKQAASVESGLRREFYDKAIAYKAEVERLRAMLAWMGNYDPALVDAAREKFRPTDLSGD
jgi:hypothetical protein